MVGQNDLQRSLLIPAMLGFHDGLPVLVQSSPGNFQYDGLTLPVRHYVQCLSLSHRTSYHKPKPINDNSKGRNCDSHTEVPMQESPPQLEGVLGTEHSREQRFSGTGFLLLPGSVRNVQMEKGRRKNCRRNISFQFRQCFF